MQENVPVPVKLEEALAGGTRGRVQAILGREAQ